MVTYYFRSGNFSVDEGTDTSHFSVYGEHSEEDERFFKLEVSIEKLPEDDGYGVKIVKSTHRPFGDTMNTTLKEFNVLKTTEEHTSAEDSVIKLNCNSSQDVLLAVLRGGSPNHMAFTKAVQFALLGEDVEFLEERPVGEVTLKFNSSVNKMGVKASALRGRFNYYLFSAIAKNFTGKEEKLDFIISTFREGDNVRVELSRFSEPLGISYCQPLGCNFNEESLPSVYREYVEGKMVNREDYFGSTVLRNLLSLGGQLFNREDVINFLTNQVRAVFGISGKNSFDALKSIKLYGNFNHIDFSTAVFDISLNEDGTIKDVSTSYVVD